MTLLRKRRDQLAVKSTHSLTKKSIPELNDQPTYMTFTVDELALENTSLHALSIISH